MSEGYVALPGEGLSSTVPTVTVQRHPLESVYLLRQCGGGTLIYVYKLLKARFVFNVGILHEMHRRAQVEKEEASEVD